MRTIDAKLISFESIEAAGKGTQLRRIARCLEGLHVPFIVAREPGGTCVGEALRAIIKYPNLAIPGIKKAMEGHMDNYDSQPIANDSIDGHDRTPECELHLFLASRAEFSAKVIEPTLAAGCHVFADRLYDSTRAYQGGGRFESDPKIREYINMGNMMTMRGRKPDLTFYLDISVATMRKRLSTEHPDKFAVFEEETLEFFERVRAEYLLIAKEEPERVKIIDAELSELDVYDEIMGYLRPLLGIDVRKDKTENKPI